MPYQMPEFATENAFQNFFTQLAPAALKPVQFLTRFSTTPKVLPCLTIVAEECKPDVEEAQYQTGNWFVTLRFTLETHYSPTAAQNALHDAYLGEVVDLLSAVNADSSEAVSEQLNTINTDLDFTAFHFDLGSRRNYVEDHSMFTEQTATLRMCAAKLT
jgi:hypothetical protein